jgi:predicted pyridoxine 5'-phosphate oxidase superfamily flavin-nucleotide-binding protein
MGNKFAVIAFTPGVRAVQKKLGSSKYYDKTLRGQPYNDELGPDETEFIRLRDTFYMASISETGWPYVQHRGGPPGFIKVLDATTIGFADYRGNRQYLSVGNLLQDDRVALILLDYPNRTRLKLLGHARIVPTAETDLMATLDVPAYGARVERGFVIKIAAYDWNCPQHITPRFTQSEIESVMGSLKARLADLETQLQECRSNRAVQPARTRPP